MLEIRDCLLVVIDVQGKLAELMHEKESLFKNISILVKAADLLEIPVVVTEQVPASLGPTVEEIAANLGETQPIDKAAFSCFGDDKFREKLISLRKSQVLICGIESHVCVYQTAADAVRSGWEVHVPADAVSSRDPSNKEVALRRLRTEGVTVSSVEMALFELMKTAEHPAFRDVSKLIK